jgi:hypothetical protein
MLRSNTWLPLWVPLLLPHHPAVDSYLKCGVVSLVQPLLLLERLQIKTTHQALVAVPVPVVVGREVGDKLLLLLPLLLVQPT